MSDSGLTNEEAKKARERQARRTVAKRLALYYRSLLDSLETDAEGFFDRVMQLEAQRQARAAVLTLRH